ncbi:hypothetical protein PWT90_00593 [Aphanocladium album]|nr:hypothetical protein PWT90_00593 [Aphanocladium album]
MHLVSSVRMAMLALSASQVLAVPAGASDRRYVPSMAPGSSPDSDSSSSSSSSADRKNSKSISGSGKLPGVNHKPINDNMMFDANVNTTAWAVVSKNVPADAVFGQKCRHLTLLGYGKEGQSTLQAVCLDDEEDAEGKGSWWLTSLNLNKCLGNDVGKLVFKPNGNYDSTCHPCGIESSSTTDGTVELRCSCLPEPGGVSKFTEISLGDDYGDLGIKAVNGRLVCGIYEGTKSPHFNATSGNGGEL